MGQDFVTTRNSAVISEAMGRIQPELQVNMRLQQVLDRLPCPAILFLVETVFDRMHDMVCDNGNEHVRIPFYADIDSFVFIAPYRLHLLEIIFERRVSAMNRDVTMFS